MKHKISNSRALRRRLLTAMISCVLAVLVICSALLYMTYQKVESSIKEQSSLLSDQTIYGFAMGMYQIETGGQRDLIHAFCSETGLDINLNKRKFKNQDELVGFVTERAKNYFASTTIRICTFFVDTGSTQKSIVLYSSEDGQENLNAAFAALTEELHTEGNIDCMGYYETFQDYLQTGPDQQQVAQEMFTNINGGYIVTWENLSHYCDQDLCLGLVADCEFEWESAISNISQQNTELLLTDMGKVFRQNFYIMLAAVGSVLVLFIILSGMLSKKLADPVVSEHTMLLQLNEMKTAFLSNVSHELKTPLAAMSGYAQNAEMELAKGGDTSGIQEQLKRISSEANRMALMVTQVLDVTRIEEGRMVLELAPCDLEKVVQETAETYFAVLNKNNNRLALRIPLELPKVKGDSARLQRVFVNMISNAMKHTHDGVIVVKAEQEEDHVKVTVKDTGSGISPEDMPHIWERYYMGKHSRTGTGLGLFICKFIIESHGGTISAESEPGQGTAFHFTLPVA